MPERFAMSANADVDSVNAVCDSLDEFAEAADCDPAVAYRVRFAVEELALNVAMHGSNVDAETRIEVAIDSSNEKVAILLVDDGPAFDPTSDAPPADVSSDIEDREVGGLGIHLVSAMLDDVSYERKAGKNRVSLTILRG